MHVAVTQHFVLADHRNVVLDVAGGHTCTASDAAREVNGHAPAVSDTVHSMLVPQVKLPRGLLVEGVDLTVAVDVIVDGQRVVLVPRRLALRLASFREVAVEACFLHHAVTIHDRVVDLGCCEGILRAGGFDGHVEGIVTRHAVLHRGETKDVGANRHGLAVCRLEMLSVFACGEGCTSNVLSSVTAAVTEGDAEGAGRLAWLHERRKLDRLAVHRHFHHRSLVALSDVGVQSHGFHVRAGHGHIVVPGHLGYGVRRFLQHGVARLVACRDRLLLVKGQFHVASC